MRAACGRVQGSRAVSRRAGNRTGRTWIAATAGVTGVATGCGDSRAGCGDCRAGGGDNCGRSSPSSSSSSSSASSPSASTSTKSCARASERGLHAGVRDRENEHLIKVLGRLSYQRIALRLPSPAFNEHQRRDGSTAAKTAGATRRLSAGTKRGVYLRNTHLAITSRTFHRLHILVTVCF